MDFLDCGDDLWVGVEGVRVGVCADAAADEEGLLRDGVEAGPHELAGESGDVDAIDCD